MSKKHIKSKWSASEFNAAYPVGTKVKYYPLIGGKDFIETATRSEAWELGCGEPVVAIEGKTGGRALAAIEIKQINQLA